MTWLRLAFGGLAGLILAGTSSRAWGQENAAEETRPAQGKLKMAEELPDIVVVARKEPAAMQTVPASVTVVGGNAIADAGIRTVKDAAEYAPNTFVNEFTVRRLSNPYFRGIGASPNNPGVTTYLDGVPQFSANSSNIELTDVQQVEFVRGPQGALFGRNAVGGIINVISRRPSLTDWRAEFTSEYGNYNLCDARMAVSGPMIKEQLGFSIAGGLAARDGPTTNTHTGRDLDSRQDCFAKMQLLLNAGKRWEARCILMAENDADGDYALGDLSAIRKLPFRVNRDYEGFTHRAIFAPTLVVENHGDTMEFSSLTGSVLWNTHNKTDLDYTAMPLIKRDDKEGATQLSQEFRFASPRYSPTKLATDLKMTWQAGVFVFAHVYEQHADSDFAPGALYFIPLPPPNPPIISPPNTLRSEAGLDDWGASVYGQAVLTAWDKLDLTFGLRYDFENKKADLREYFTTFDPLLSAPVSCKPDKSCNEVSPHGAIAWRFDAGQMAYFSIARGYKAGGFNPVSPSGCESYGAEHGMNYELGYKSRWFKDKLQANLALFHMDWDDLQLNVPVVSSPGRYYIANVGSATSQGVELEINGRPYAGWDLFGSMGCTRAIFGDGSRELGKDISGNRLPFTPSCTANIGTQYSWAVCESATLYARTEATVYGGFVYDSSNAERQDTYSLAKFRAGVRGSHWFAEGWVRNAFNTHYVPIAFPFRVEFAPSGYLGECGSPAAFGLRFGLSF